MPGQRDESSPERAAWFATTHWSVIFKARDADTAHSDAALEKLCHAYWSPLYAYIRREGFSVEDAQDLTQEFFRRFLEKKWLNHLQHRQGKFRSFLLTFLKHFLADERDRAAAQKRGGHFNFITLDEFAAQEREGLELAAGLTPDQVFDRQWVRKILDLTLNRLRQEYAAKGRLELFEMLKDTQPGQQGVSSYAEIGRQFGMAEGSVKSAVHRLRERYREIWHEEISETVHGPDQIAEEVRYLMSVGRW